MNHKSPPGTKILIVENFPYSGMESKFERSGRQWKIGVSYQMRTDPLEYRQIWDATLRLASDKLKVKRIRNPEGVWIQRLWRPLSRDGQPALAFVDAKTSAVVMEAGNILMEIGNTPTW